MLWVTFTNFQRYNYHDKRVRWKFYYRRKSTQLLLQMKGQICLFIPRYQRTQATVRISDRLMPLDEYPCIFSRLMVATVHLIPEQNHAYDCGFSFGLNQLNYRFLAQDNNLHGTKYICSGFEGMSCLFVEKKAEFHVSNHSLPFKNVRYPERKSRWDRETMKWVTLSEVN